MFIPQMEDVRLTSHITFERRKKVALTYKMPDGPTHKYK